MTILQVSCHKPLNRMEKFTFSSRITSSKCWLLRTVSRESWWEMWMGRGRTVTRVFMGRLFCLFFVFTLKFVGFAFRPQRQWREVTSRCFSLWEGQALLFHLEFISVGLEVRRRDWRFCRKYGWWSLRTWYRFRTWFNPWFFCTC